MDTNTKLQKALETLTRIAEIHTTTGITKQEISQIAQKAINEINNPPQQTNPTNPQYKILQNLPHGGIKIAILRENP